MAKMMKDPMLEDYKLITLINNKIKYILPIYFISDYGLVFGKSKVPFSEQFANIKDDFLPSELQNVLIDGEDFYVHGRNNRTTGLTYSFKDDLIYFVSPPRKGKKDEEGMITPEGVYVKKYKHNDIAEMKDTFYKYLNHMDLFRLKALPYQRISESQLEDLMEQNEVEITIDGISIIIDASLFPDTARVKDQLVISAALVPSDLIPSNLHLGDDEALFIIRQDTKWYDSFALLKVMVV